MIDVSQASSPLSSVQPIKEVLDIHQGYDTDLSDPTPFDAPFHRFGPDQPIHQHDNPEHDDDDHHNNPPQSSFPHYAMMVLKNITYFSADEPIRLEGYASVDAVHRLRQRSLKGSPINFQFSTYALDQVLHTWFQRFQGGSEEQKKGIRGRITKIHIVETDNKKMGDGTWRPLVQMEISPIPGLIQTLLYRESVREQPIEVFWGPSKKHSSLTSSTATTVKSTKTTIKNKLIKDKSAAFHQIVMGDVLF
ncbi:hypothetical protein INT45_000205 [Circinella minor]|uniref:Uncharacterized protein n=1 Tax=Circinella minor TaxID=1195481 RepID=A0A8H7S3W9_9FUNG|nr:hypothetical protein INT45_000205 [Circinella minor]